jgi:hypothetical protein
MVLRNKEKMPVKELIMNMPESKEKPSFRYEILYPGGNTTAVVFVDDIEVVRKDPQLRKAIHEDIKMRCPQLEQTGFLDLSDPTMPKVMMAGGEFCGNFLRCCSYLQYLASSPGERKATTFIKFILEDKELILRVGVDGFRKAWAEIPLLPQKSEFEVNKKFQIVELEGITHIVTELPELEVPENFIEREKFFVNLAEEFLIRENLLSLRQEIQALGVMFIRRQNEQLYLDPIVWVKGISCYYETAWDLEAQRW